ncbi:HutD/Ves family protein [Kribbella sp. NPDC055110]
MMILTPADVPPMPWKNGAGTTRELAVAHDDDGRMLWRISVAELAVATHFSSLPGLDRSFTALGRLELTIGGERKWFEKGDQARFAGEEEVVLRSLPSRTSALNVMTRRGRCTAGVTLHPTADGLCVDTDHIVDLGDCVAQIRIRTSGAS